MSCFYIGKGVKFTTSEMLHAFYKENYIIRNSEIFSSEELQKNTYNKLLTLFDSNNYNKSENPKVTDFIVQQNELLRSIKGLNSNRLSPEYILENRVKEYVEKNINNPDTLSYIDPNTEVDEMFSKIEPELRNSVKEQMPKVRFLINEILADVAVEEINKDFGIDIHGLIGHLIRNNVSGYESKLNEITTNDKYIPIFGTAPREDWKAKIDSIAKNVQSSIMKFGDPISEIFLNVNDINLDKFALRGKIDLIAIDIKGNAHIFEIKVSKNSYERGKWDSAKLLNLDWQLALYKQLLSQHVNVNNTELYVIPIILNTPGDPTALMMESIHNRNTESKHGLRNGHIEEVANQIIPRGINPEYDPTKIDNFREKLTKLFGEDYEIKLSKANTNFDVELETIINRQKRYGGKFKFYNAYRNIEGLEPGSNEADTLDEIKPLVKIYVNYLNQESVKAKKVSELKSSLKDAIIAKTKITSNNSEYDIKVNRLLLEYLTDVWEVIEDFPESTALGLILLRNKNSGQVNVISLSVNQFLAESSIPDYNYGDIEYSKALLFLNEYKDSLLPYSTNKIGEIIVFNPENQKHYYRTTYNQYNKFFNLMHSKNFNDSDIKLSFDTHFVGLVNVALQNLDNFYRSFDNDLDKEKLENIIRPLTSDDNLHLDKLIKAQQEFYELYPTYKNKTFSPELNFEDKKEVLLALLNTAILSYHTDDIGSDFQSISNFSMNWSDYRDLFSSLWTGHRLEYDESGRKITGIFQGLVWSTPDWVPSKDLRNINKIIAGANSRIGEIMLRASEQCTKHTLKYYDAINFSETERFIIGETQSKYMNLWQHKGSEVSEDFITKNPYVENVENSLTEPEREYLKNMLFLINCYRLEISEEEQAELNPNNLASILRNEKIATSYESGKYFDMPLVRREEISKHLGKFKTKGQTFQDWLTPMKDEFADLLSPKGLTQEELVDSEKSEVGFYEMYDTYSKHTPEFKARAVDKHTINYFEFNLDSIANRVIFNKVRKNTYDKAFPVVNAYIWYMKYAAGKSSDDISGQLKYVSDQIKLSAFGQHIIDPEFKDLTVGQAMIKKLSSALILGFKPISLAKELTIGTMKGVMLASTQIYGKDQFGIKDLGLAYKKLLTIDKQFSQEFNLIDKINALYRFANMDANTLYAKLQTDRHGMVMRGVSRYMYASNTIPDYYNRLVLFLAKMIHDGSYDAHTNEDGELKYDPKKDKRFSYYLQEREKHKVGDEYIAATNDQRYNTQRRQYLLLISQLNEEQRIYGEALTEADLIPKAYSEKERSSFKSFTDMAYGYYDKDAQQQATNTWWGLTWLQMMQYWPGKMKMWFGKPTKESGEDSAIGAPRQAKTKDGKLLWRKTLQDEAGKYYTETTTEETGDPELVWQGTPFEGLIYSCTSLIRDLATLDFGKVTNDKDRLGRVAFAISDAIFMYIMFNVFTSMFKALKKDSPEGLSKELMSFGESLSKKVTNEQNLYQSTFGALNSDPVWLSWAKKLSTDMGDVFEGNKTIMDVSSRSIGALEMFKEEK